MDKQKRKCWKSLSELFTDDVFITIVSFEALFYLKWHQLNFLNFQVSKKHSENFDDFKKKTVLV